MRAAEHLGHWHSHRLVLPALRQSAAQDASRYVRLAALHAQINEIGDQIEVKHDRGDYFGATVLRKDLGRAQYEVGRLRRAVERLLAIPLCLIPFGLGFLAILVSPQRRGWHARLAAAAAVGVAARRELDARDAARCALGPRGAGLRLAAAVPAGPERSAGDRWRGTRRER